MNKEELILKTLIDFIKQNNQINYFSLGPSEQRICLEKNNNIWEVYILERGIKFEISKHNDLYDASIKVIKHLSNNKKEFKIQETEFKRMLKI